MSRASAVVTPRSGIAVSLSTCVGCSIQRMRFAGVFVSTPAMYTWRARRSSGGPTRTFGTANPRNGVARATSVACDGARPARWVTLRKHHGLRPRVVDAGRHCQGKRDCHQQHPLGVTSTEPLSLGRCEPETALVRSHCDTRVRR